MNGTTRLEVKMMRIGKIFLSFSLGFLLAALAIGLLPFLLIFNLADVAGYSELFTSPLFLIDKLYKDRNQKEQNEDCDIVS